MSLNCFRCEHPLNTEASYKKVTEDGEPYFKCSACHFKNMVTITEKRGLQKYEFNVPLVFFREAKLNEATGYLISLLTKFHDFLSTTKNTPEWVNEYINNALRRAKRGHRPLLSEMEILGKFLESNKDSVGFAEQVITAISVFSKCH